MVRMRRWDARVFRSQPSASRMLDFLNGFGNGPWVAPAFLGLGVVSLICALVLELAGRHLLAGQAVGSTGWTFVAALVSRFAWSRRCQERR
ncbi:MAG: hypothetical protein JWO88_3250 [Frankiales bacterium]|nr:hypothetical protein [Frankiales bacterium]